MVSLCMDKSSYSVRCNYAQWQLYLLLDYMQFLIGLVEFLKSKKLKNSLQVMQVPTVVRMLQENPINQRRYEKRSSEYVSDQEAFILR